MRGGLRAIAVADLGERDDGRLRMRFKHPFQAGEEIRLDRIAVVIEADHDLGGCEAQHPVPRGDRAPAPGVLEDDEARELAMEHRDGIVRAAVGADQHLIGRGGKRGQRRAGPAQFATAVLARDHDRERH